MSYKTQEKHMKRLAELVSQDLACIFGPRESGPNGAKKEYLQTGKTFLRAVAKDLGFRESNVYDTPGGIGVSGELSLMGMWSGGNGIHIVIRQNDFLGCILYREIRHIKDYTGGCNCFLGLHMLKGSYDKLLEIFLTLKREVVSDARAS